MFLWRAKEILEGGSEFVRAEAELMSKRLNRLLINSLILLTLTLTLFLGTILVTAGIAVALSIQIGWAPSLVIVGVVYLLASLALYGVLRCRSNATFDAESDQTNDATQDNPEEKAEEAKDRMDNAVSKNPKQQDKQQESESTPADILSELDSLKDAAVDLSTKNPVAVGSAVLLTLSILGPRKSFRMISKGAAAVGLMSTLLDSTSSKPDTK
ncbi:MAG: hypothetical protein RLN78_07465 [Phycisphaerales bacterium]